MEEKAQVLNQSYRNLSSFECEGFDHGFWIRCWSVLESESLFRASLFSMEKEREGEGIYGLFVLEVRRVCYAVLWFYVLWLCVAFD